MAPTPPPTRAPEPRPGLTDAQKWILGGIGAVVVLLLVVVTMLVLDDDDGDDEVAPSTTTTDTTTTTEPTTTTAAPDEPTTTIFQPEIDAYEVAFPSPGASRRFEEPAAAARAYATDVLGFTELVLSAPQPGQDGTSGVVVQPSEDGPETTIELVQSGDAWFVTGSHTPDITVTEPAPGTSLASPFETSGEALTFEGNVEVVVLAQDGVAPLGQGAVTGSGTPPPGPFQGDVPFFPPPEPTPGVLVYRASSAQDGRVLAATSVRVRLTNLAS